MAQPLSDMWQLTLAQNRCGAWTTIRIFRWHVRAHSTSNDCDFLCGWVDQQEIYCLVVAIRWLKHSRRRCW